ncbi:MAG: hypothetical protein JOZ47_20185 [Kutzneria sp.]|nr:hypothetical protein [Kutzneria sp.]
MSNEDEDLVSPSGKKDEPALAKVIGYRGDGGWIGRKLAKRRQARKSQQARHDEDKRPSGD